MQPFIAYFDPVRGLPGCIITLHGSGFSSNRLDNTVRIGGRECFVISASPNELRAIVPRESEGGKVEVWVHLSKAVGPHSFVVQRQLLPGEDGPPILFEGAGDGTKFSDALNPIGTIRVLVILLRPNDISPPDPNVLRAKVAAEWTKVKEYYRQVSYGRTIIEFDILDGWANLDGPLSTFVYGDQFKNDQWTRIVAIAAKAAVDKGIVLNDYQMMANTVVADGMFIRGAAGGFRKVFFYEDKLPKGDPKKFEFFLVLPEPISEIMVGEAAKWGRIAHELGHDFISEPLINEPGEVGHLTGDLYGSAGTAQRFDLMGEHEEHPLFSGFHMESLGYYKPDNILELAWNRNPFKQEFELVAHGSSEDTAPGRFHLIKVKVAAGLYYYIEVRQRPGTAEPIFDRDIPLPHGGSPNQGGVIVTSVITGTFHVNQPTRFVTLLQDPTILATPTESKPVTLPKGANAEDPMRKLRIAVVDDDVQAQPLVCRVRVEWATVADDPKGAFDLQVEPWDSGYQTPDLWVDRLPYKSFENPLDSKGRPIGNGDRPRPREVNLVQARVRVSGAVGAKDVKVTYYSVTPPGIGDNGNWAPLGTRSIPEIPPNTEVDAPPVEWIPVVDKHTCLMVAVTPQAGEISGGNNFAQENIATFYTATNSPIEPVVSRTAIRNPLPHRRLVHIDVDGVPEGWRVQFPHSWVWLEGKAEKQFDLVVIPFRDYRDYGKGGPPKHAEIKVNGRLLHDFGKPPGSDEPPPSRLCPIGGVLNEVHIRQKATIRLSDASGDVWTIRLLGHIEPDLAEQDVRVELLDPVGRRRVREVRTEGGPYFEATFDLRFAPSPDADPKHWKKASGVEKGAYRARAEIIGATVASDAVSNVFFVYR